MTKHTLFEAYLKRANLIADTCYITFTHQNDIVALGVVINEPNKSNLRIYYFLIS